MTQQYFRCVGQGGMFAPADAAIAPAVGRKNQQPRIATMPTNNTADGNPQIATLEPPPSPVPGLGMCTVGPRNSATAYNLTVKIHKLVRMSSEAAGGVTASAPWA
jgi:hypothetical protein